MEAILVVVVVVLAVLVAVDLLLTGAMIRRLADHERRLAAIGGMPLTPGGLAPGSPLPAFTAETLDGRRVDPGFLGDGRAVIAFFSTSCSACVSHVPEFARVAAGASALAVVLGDGSGDALLSGLGTVPVVREPEIGGALATSFEIDTFPTYYVVEGGSVVATVGSAGQAADLLAVTHA